MELSGPRQHHHCVVGCRRCFLHRLVDWWAGRRRIAGLREHGTGPDNHLPICGIVLFLMSVLELGFLASSLSRPILIGFVGGVSLDIFVSQIARMLGVRFSDPVPG